jgi:hypothetical protein
MSVFAMMILFGRRYGETECPLAFYEKPLSTIPLPSAFRRKDSPRTRGQPK